MNLIIFDLDKTLINCDCEKEFIKYFYNKKIINNVFYKKSNMFYKKYKKGKLNIKKYIKYISKFLNKILYYKNEINKIVKIISKKINKKVMYVLKKERDKKNYILISTSSCYFISNNVLKRLKINNLICTKIIRMKKKFTGKINGVPNIGNGKVLNLKKYINKKKIKYKKIIFYSDSINDLPMMIYSDKTFLVNPDRWLSKILNIKKL
ncbi:HAD-IB family hydrolase [Candidatus Vidania fulgoroideorum]